MLVKTRCSQRKSWVAGTVILIALFWLTSCSPKKIDDAPGVIVFPGSEKVYWPSKGVVLTHEEPEYYSRLEGLCAGAGDTLFADAQRLDSSRESIQSQIVKIAPVWDSLGNRGQIVLDSPPYWCTSLQHVPSSNTYVFAGSVDGEQTIVEFDRDWNELRRLSHSQLFDSTEGSFSGAFQLANGELLIGSHSSFYKTDWSGKALAWRNPLRRLLSISPDGRFIVYAHSPRHNTAELYEYNSETDKIKLIESSDDVIISACYSPDGRYIAYTKRNYDWLDAIYLHIYDRERDDSFISWVTGDTEGILWVGGIADLPEMDGGGE